MSEGQANGAAGGGAPRAVKSQLDYGKTAGFLAVGVGLTGIVTYAYFLVASHLLSKHDYSQITILWSAVFITISTLYCPIEQLLSRHVSEHQAKGEPIGQPVRVAAKIQLGLSLAFAVVALALRGPIEHGVLGGNQTLYWVFFAAVLFYGVSYFARGFLAGLQRFGLFVSLILSESCFRTLFAVLVAVSLLSGQSAVALGIVAAPTLGLMVVPAAFARRARRSPTRHGGGAERNGEAEAAAARRSPADGGEFSLAHGSGFAAAVLLIMFSEQAFLNAGPLIIRGLEAGFIFNVLMIARAPLQLFQSVSTSILPHLTSLHISKEEDSERQFHHTVLMVLAVVAAFTALTVTVILIAGPKLMQIAFSKKYTYDREGLLLIACGMGLYLSSVTVNQACVAQGQVRRAALRWISCAAIFIGWNFVPLVSNTPRRVEIGFLLAAGVLFSLLYYVYRRPHERPEDVPEVGSGEDVGARLALLDENV